MDDVLKTIVNKDRMSFNDLSPAYKEMVMKLALTLSKDEIFQRSKNIMRQNPNNKSKSRSSAGKLVAGKSSSSNVADSDAEHSTSSSRISSVLRATKKSFSKWGSRSASTGYSVTSKEDKHEPLLLKNTRLNVSEPIKVFLFFHFWLRIN